MVMNFLQEDVRKNSLRRGTGHRWLFSLMWMVAGWLGSGPLLKAQDKAGVEFFDSRVRPIFEKRCFKCHSESAGKAKGGLELDWKGGWEKGGDSGPAVVPGQPEKSLLIKAVRYQDQDLQMPPKGEKLSDSEIASLTEWVKRGAPDPRTAKTSGAGSKSKEHWAFQPVKDSAVPRVQESAWVANPLDAFVLSKLEENGLKHAAPADRRALIRRAYFDLIGLPPTAEETEAFVADTAPNAFEKVVDHLLASPHYGERWGRHWLDVARYSDTKGQFRRQKESSLYPYAWTYRDYVIRAFNEDKPYDQFIKEQLAADRFPKTQDNHVLAALGFLTVGEHFMGNENEIINDRIDVVTKGFLGLTVTCARCHDHRFDPIPQADYYSLHGIFASSAQPATTPLLSGFSTNNADYEDYARKRADLDSKLREVSTNIAVSAFGDYRRLAGVYLFATTLSGEDQTAYLKKNGADPELLKNWEQVIRVGSRREFGVFRLWQFFRRLPPGRFAEQSRRAMANLATDERTKKLPPAMIDFFRVQSPKSIAEVASLYGMLFAKNDPAWQSVLSQFFMDVGLNIVPNRVRGRYFALREQYDRLELVHSGAPPRAMWMVDSTTPKDSPIFLRGEPANPGSVVPRRFLEILSGPTRPAFMEGSGRWQLAQAIASTNNPLTARVFVNRVWMHHFGEGIVTTPDDFGNQSAPPSHPELLDWLASRFMKEGWSIKRLHKTIMLSNTYQQSSDVTEKALASDPANRWLSHANVHRLEYEPFRDSILAVSGQLDLAMGGKPVDLSEGTHRGPEGRRFGAGGIKLSTAERRSVYGFIDRVDLLEVLNTFDFANPAMCNGKRYETSVPQQALFLMNSPLVVEQARHLVERPEFLRLESPDDRVRLLYRWLFQRAPSSQELQAGKRFIESWVPAVADASTPAPEAENGPKKRPRDRRPQPNANPKPLSGWGEYAHALMMTTEMAFVD